RRLLPKQERLNLAVFAPDGHSVASGTVKQPLRFWDLRTGKVRRTLSRPLMPIGYVPKSNLLAVGQPGEKPVLRLWDLRKDREQARLGTLLNEMPAVAFAADGKTIATMGPDLEVWDVASGQARLKFPVRDMGPVAFSPDGRFVACAGLMEGVVRVW